MRLDWTRRTRATLPLDLDDFLDLPDDLPADESSEDSDSEVDDDDELLFSEFEDDGVSDSESVSTRRAFLRGFLGFLQAAAPLKCHFS